MNNILYSGCDNKYNIEFTIHNCPIVMKRDIQSVFKNDINLDTERLLIIPTWQKAALSLLCSNQTVSNEMDRLYLNFQNWVGKIKEAINKAGYWLDVSCPHTGKALYGNPTNHIYNELEGLTKLLKYDNDKVGCCGMVYHPEFKDRSYPITTFTNIPVIQLQKILYNLYNIELVKYEGERFINPNIRKKNNGDGWGHGDNDSEVQIR